MRIGNNIMLKLGKIIWTFIALVFLKTSLFAMIQSEDEQNLSPSTIQALQKEAIKDINPDSNKKKERKPRKRTKKKFSSNENHLEQSIQQEIPRETLTRETPIGPQHNKVTNHNKEEVKLDLKIQSARQNLPSSQKGAQKKLEVMTVDRPQAKIKTGEHEDINVGQESTINLPTNFPEKHIPILEKLILQVIEEKREDPLMVNIPMDKVDTGTFHTLFRDLTKKYPFPFTWSSRNVGPQNPKEESSPYIIQVSLYSLAKERERIEKDFVYQVSQQEEKEVNWPLVFDAAMRSKFTLEDFKFNNSIKVRLIDLQGDSEEKSLEEFSQFLETKLPKDRNPFHILGIKVNKKIVGSQGRILEGLLKKVSELNTGFHTRGVVSDSRSGSIYICLDNIHRKTLDLHGKKLPSSGEYEGRSVKEAGDETRDFIIQAYETFQDDVTVLTGRGNHVNTNGRRGALKEAFRKEWMKDNLLGSIIKNYFPLEGEGGYKIIFIKPEILDLNNKGYEESLPLIRQTIGEMIEKEKTRLRILLNFKDSSPSQNLGFNLIMRISQNLSSHEPGLRKAFFPISFESSSEELKMIFRKEHPKCPSSFCFSSSYGNTSVFGTIR